MEMHEEQVSGVTALAVKGRLDSTTAPLLARGWKASWPNPAAAWWWISPMWNT